VAVIMDGNGRWAEARGLPRVAGHREGAAAVRAVVRAARRVGLEALTLYAFSMQNWARPADEVGALMRRGLIAVLGDVGDFAGLFMIAGSLFVLGRLGMRPGAGMKRATIVTFHPAELLPTFRYDCTYRPAFLRLLLEGLRTHGVAVGDEFLDGAYRRYSGDFTALGKGEILVWQNPSG